MELNVHNAGDGVVLVELPAMIGSPVYMVSGQKRWVYTNYVAEYVIRGNNPGRNSVKLVYTDAEGLPHFSWWDLTAFGKTLFTGRDDAFRRMEEVWDSN